MLATKVIGCLTLSLVVLACAGGAAFPYDPQTKPADNSGRRLAALFPGMPHPPSSSTAIKIPYATVRAGESAGSVPFVIERIIGKPQPTSLPVPFRLSPGAQKAFGQAVAVAQGMSSVAWKQVSDWVVWVAILTRQNNDLPRVSPMSAMIVPSIGVAHMSPISDPGKRSQLVLTSEYRLRTVAGR